jgi:hypothetical protein
MGTLLGSHRLDGSLTSEETVKKTSKRQAPATKTKPKMQTKTAPKKPAVKFRRHGTVEIDRWDEIEPRLDALAHSLSHCEHDLGPLMGIVKNLYLCAFGQGLVNGLMRGKNPRAKKVTYARPEDMPDNIIDGIMKRAFEKIVMSHAQAEAEIRSQMSGPSSGGNAPN